MLTSTGLDFHFSKLTLKSLDFFGLGKYDPSGFGKHVFDQRAHSLGHPLSHSFYGRKHKMMLIMKCLRDEGLRGL